MKANNAARVATKQQLEVLVSKLNEYTKRKPLNEAEASASSVPAPAPTASSATTAPAQGQQPIQAAPASGASNEDLSAENQDAGGIPTVSDVIDQLNALRSGRSLKDAEVKTQLDRYFEGLDDSEKEAMHAYFKGVAQILSGQVDGGAAEDPKNHGVATELSGKRTKHIKPNVIRNTTPKTTPSSAGAAASVAASTPPRENTAPPAPIVPKKR